MRSIWRAPHFLISVVLHLPGVRSLLTAPFVFPFFRESLGPISMLAGVAFIRLGGLVLGAAEVWLPREDGDA